MLLNINIVTSDNRGWARWLRLFGTICPYWIEAEKKHDCREQRGATKVQHLWACSTFMVITNDLNSTFKLKVITFSTGIRYTQCKFKRCFIVDWWLFLFVAHWWHVTYFMVLRSTFPASLRPAATALFLPAALPETQMSPPACSQLLCYVAASVAVAHVVMWEFEKTCWWWNASWKRRSVWNFFDWQSNLLPLCCIWRQSLYYLHQYIWLCTTCSSTGVRDLLSFFVWSWFSGNSDHLWAGWKDSLHPVEWKQLRTFPSQAIMVWQQPFCEGLKWGRMAHRRLSPSFWTWPQPTENLMPLTVPARNSVCLGFRSVFPQLPTTF